MSSETTSPGGPRYTRGQRRLLTAAAGLVVAGLAGGAYVLTFDTLRDLAVEGRASRRWAPVYPVMADALTALTILSLVVARHARWWTRLPRWALLLALVGGVAGLSAQESLRGFGALPDDPLRTGVAVAPHVLLVLAVWLWLTMIKQLRAAAPAADAADPPGGQRGHVKVIEPPAAEPGAGHDGADRRALEHDPAGPGALPGPPALAALAGPVPEPRRPVAGTTRPDLVMPAGYARDDDEDEYEDDRSYAREAGESGGRYDDEYYGDEDDDSAYAPAQHHERDERDDEYDQDDDGYEVDDPEDERADEGGDLNGREPAAEEEGGLYGLDGDEHEDPLADRAEDPEAGGGDEGPRHRVRERERDGEGTGRGAGGEAEGEGGELPIWGWTPPPSGSFRSSPVPPAE